MVYTTKLYPTSDATVFDGVMSGTVVLIIN